MSTVASTGSARSARFVVGLAMVGAAACILPFAWVRIGPWPFFLPSFLTAVVVFDSITSFLLMQQYLVRGEARMLGLAATYLFSAAAVIAHGLTFPGVVGPQGLFGAPPSTTIWLWVAWHVGFPLGLALSLMPWPWLARLSDLEPQSRRLLIVVLGAAVPIGVAAMTSFLTASAATLPGVISGDDYQGMGRAVGWPVVAIDTAALGAVLLKGRQGEPIVRWLPLTALASLSDTVLVLAGQDRWSAGWYAGRVMSTVAAAVILVVLLHEVTVLYRHLWDAHERLIEESRHDFLTALLTRREGLRRAASLLQQASRNDFGISVALLDVDHFKAFNDTHGHGVGDRVLEEVAARVRASLRAGDFAFRLGGEEFAIVFSHAQEEDAMEASWRILRTIRTRPVRTEDGLLTVTASIGVAQARGDEEVEQLIERADQALYEAKRSGRDRVRGHSRLMVVEAEA